MIRSPRTLDILQRARRRHDRAEAKAREAHGWFLLCVQDWQDAVGADRAICRRSVLDALENLRNARDGVLDACWSMQGVHAAVEGMRA